MTGEPDLRLDSRTGRGVLAAAVLASGVAFLDGTVVNAALPAIAHDLDASLADLQWVITAYLLTLGAFLVLGGSLGDHFGRRRILVFGLLGLRGDVGAVRGSRRTPGCSSALVRSRALPPRSMVPGSLAIVQASFRPVDRGRAIGAWSGLAGVSVALGPFLGGWLIDAVSVAPRVPHQRPADGGGRAAGPALRAGDARPDGAGAHRLAGRRRARRRPRRGRVRADPGSG